MKSRFQFLASLTIILAAFAAWVVISSPRSALASGNGPDDAKALIKLDEEWSKAAGKRDVDLIVSYYAEDAVVHPPNEPVVKGRAGAKKVWGAYLAEPSFNISWKTVNAEVSGDLGFTSGTYEDSYKGADGKMVHEKGKFLCVWKKQKDGSWKAIQDMWNSDAK